MRNLFAGLGELGAAYQAVDWASTPLGPVEAWDEALRGAVDLMLDTRFAVMLGWGPELVMLYNEAYVEMIGDKHPAALGRPVSDVFPEAWDLVGPLFARVREGRGATFVEDEYVPLERHGFLEECYFTFSYSPVRGARGEVEGVMDIATETTEEVIARRRLRLLGRLTHRLADVESLEEVPRDAISLLQGDPADFPSVAIRLGGTTYGSRCLPEQPLGGAHPGRGILETRDDRRVAWLQLTAPALEGPHPPDPLEEASLVVELSPRLPHDESYLSFLRLVSASLRQALDRVRGRTAERRAAEVQRSMSEALQRTLLPQPVAWGGARVAVRYQPATELAQVGGDWYDVFELPDSSLALVIGDVAGHDQEAAAAMSQVRNMTRGVAYATDPVAPGAVLSGVDRAMRGTAHEIVATALLARLHEGAGGGLVLEWSSAGHPPPVLVGPDGVAELLERPADLLLGLDDTTPRRDHRAALAPGTTVFLYTDGLVERRGAPFTDGLAWLVEEVSGCQGSDVEAICDRLLAVAEAEDDDVALLVLRT